MSDEQKKTADTLFRGNGYDGHVVSEQASVYGSMVAKCRAGDPPRYPSGKVEDHLAVSQLEI